MLGFHFVLSVRSSSQHPSTILVKFFVAAESVSLQIGKDIA